MPLPGISHSKEPVKRKKEPALMTRVRRVWLFQRNSSSSSDKESSDTTSVQRASGLPVYREWPGLYRVAGRDRGGKIKPPHNATFYTLETQAIPRSY